MSGRHMRRALLFLALLSVAVLLPGAGQSRPPESDGSTYTWTGAATLTVDVKPWGGGYVRSDPYLIDCPMACVRAFEANREVKLTAYTTPGHTFKAWEGACAGQGNPCTIKVSGAMDVTAVLEGQYVPPAPPPASAPPANVNPALSVDVQAGDCDPQCFTMDFTGTGFNPTSAIDLTLAYVTPDFGTYGAVVATSDAAGGWSRGFYEDCQLPDAYSGPVVIDVTATDAQGASASTQVNGVCP